MAKKRPAKSPAKHQKQKGDRCWEGFEPTPSKKPFTKGSCKPKAK